MGDARDPENPRGQLSSPKGARDAGRGQSYKNALCFSPCKSRHVLWVGRTRPETKTQRPRERRRVGGRVSSSPLHPLGVRPCTAIPAGCPEQGWAPQKRLCPVRGLSGARGSWKAVTLEEPRASRLRLICPDMVGPCRLKGMCTDKHRNKGEEAGGIIRGSRMPFGSTSKGSLASGLFVNPCSACHTAHQYPLRAESMLVTGLAPCEAQRGQ